jgi:hypothetical protein
LCGHQRINGLLQLGSHGQRRLIRLLVLFRGRTATEQAGDRFVIPRGFVGTWEVVATTTKRFVIFEPKA